MEWRQLEYFRVVAETEHFTKAAERLAISQPALSRSITTLEEELGVLLFDRIGRTVRINLFGKRFLKHVERALNEIHSGVEEIAQLNDPTAGKISIAFLLSLGLNVLPEVIGKFSRKYPKVEIAFYQHPTPYILKYLIAGEVDLCLTEPVNQSSGIIWHKLLDEELFAYLPLNHYLSEQPAINLTELAREPFISFKKNYGMRLLVEKLSEEAGFKPQIKFEGEDIATVMGLVSSGLGITILPAFLDVDFNKTRRIAIGKPTCHREIGLAWLEERILPPSVELFRDFLIEQFESK